MSYNMIDYSGDLVHKENKRISTLMVLMALCKSVVSSVLVHWRYRSFLLNHVQYPYRQCNHDLVCVMGQPFVIQNPRQVAPGFAKEILL